MPKILERWKTEKEERALTAGEIIGELRRLEQQIRENEQIFNLSVEHDLIEACIYDGKALRSRYRYYHNMARKLGIRAETWQV